MIKLFRNWVTNTFGFSKAETNGSLLLIFLIIAISIIPRWILNTKRNTEVSQKQDEITLQRWHEKIQLSSAKNDDVNTNEVSDVSDQATKFNLRDFNPNQISFEELLAMGFPRNIAKNMIGYRKAGGSFNLKSDLQKIYGMKDEFYSQVKRFIELPEVLPEERKQPDKTDYDDSATTEITKIKIININHAAADELISIDGIGSVLSERIIKYRDLLGGFHSYDQFREVYGLKEEVIQKMRESVIFDSVLVKINLNTLEPGELTAHPYIEYKLARLIINYQKVHGPYQEKSDIRKIKIVSDSLFQKLSPYISVSPLLESE